MEQLARSLLMKTRVETWRNGAWHGYSLWGQRGGEVSVLGSSGKLELGVAMLGRQGLERGWSIWGGLSASGISWPFLKPWEGS